MRTQGKAIDLKVVGLPPPTVDDAYRGAVGRLMLLRGVAMDTGDRRMVMAAEMALEALSV